MSNKCFVMNSSFGHGDTKICINTQSDNSEKTLNLSLLYLVYFNSHPTHVPIREACCSCSQEKIYFGSIQ